MAENRLPAGPSDAGSGLLATPPDSSHLGIRILAFTAMVLLGFRRELPLGITTGTLVVVALLPVWVPVVRRYGGATILTVATMAAFVWGVWLTANAPPTNHVDTHLLVTDGATLLTFLLGVGVILWAREVIGVNPVGIAFGVGLTATAILAAGGENTWKYYFAVPVAIVLLALAGATRSRLTIALAFVAITVSGAVSDFRSLAGCSLLAGILWYWRDRRSVHATGSAGRFRVFVTLIATVVGMYFLLTAAMGSGAFGEAIQQRTIAQESYSGGSVLSGGRPEWAGTLELMKARPGGYGVGVVPSGSDIQLALNGLASTGVPTIRGYANHFLFDGGFKLHSVTADLWVGYGFAGIALAVILAILLVKVLVNTLVDRHVPVVVIFLSMYSLFQIAVGPIWTSLPLIALALGLGLYKQGALHRERTDVLSVTHTTTSPVPPGLTRT